MPSEWQEELPLLSGYGFVGLAVEGNPTRLRRRGALGGLGIGSIEEIGVERRRKTYGFGLGRSAS